MFVLLLSLLFLPVCGLAQEIRKDSVVVTGTYEPVPLEEADRAVRTIEVGQQLLTSASLADFLQLDPALDLRQRAPGGVQADLSIRGSTFGQTLVLLDGLRMNDAQSGHHNLDLPVALDMVERLEILRGAGSSLYGSDAVGGVIHVITGRPQFSEVALRTAVGSFGTNQQRWTASALIGSLSQRLAVSRDFSSGFQENRDYRNLLLSSLTHWRRTRVMLGHRDSPFGAQGFYGAYPSWERTKAWYASATQGLDRKTDLSFSFRRHTDLFVLYRYRPEVYTNRHAVESYQGALRRREEFAPNVRVFYGAEGWGDAIQSTNLGRHSRARAAAYAALDVRALRRFSFSAGLRGESHGAFQRVWSPTVAGGAWLSPNWKLRASASRAFRVPTYTELYYHDPANAGSPDLRPENAWSYEGGVEWNSGGRWRADAAFFARREKDVIDYVRRTARDIWRATNFQRLNFRGAEAALSFRLSPVQQLDLRYAALHGSRDFLQGFESKYVFNYPSHSAVAGWQWTGRGVALRTRLGAVNRLRRDPYAVWDLYAARVGGRLNPFLQLTNLGGTRYEEIPGVSMPGRAAVFGVQCILWRSR
jgi:iron complex outermembrane receptor protein